MALVIRDVSALKPDIRLAQAVSEFEAALTAEQKLAFRASRTAALSTAPTMSDVMRLTAEMDLKATSKHGRIRCFGPRLTNMLQAIQQFAALGDIVVGGSQNLIACGVWSAARMTVHVMTGYLTHLEKLSVLFMTVGRNAPRYQAMAAIYPKSKNLQRYLCEYFIVVTNLCYQLVTWVQRPALNRISTSFRDPDMKGFQADLETWSASIKEEADLLLSQRFQEEAKENATFRSIVSSRFGYLHHQQKINQRIRFLDACSQHDYRTTWKQTRKRGTTRILPSYSQYQKWKSASPTGNSILFHGKLGAGKSVLLANIIDDLNLLQNTITLYFFACHDIPNSLNSRTIFGALVRQLLENFVYDTQSDKIFVDPVSKLDLDNIIEVFTTIPHQNRTVYIVLDGLDECSTEEQRTVLRYLSWIRRSGYRTCVSVRTPSEISVWKDQSFDLYESIPEENQDISDFVQVEVDNRVRNGQLVTLDSLLIQDIKQELIEGACGMFLWVSLQLDSICSEMSDSAIREAIHDLPQDLTQAYERNLVKASSGDSKGHHVRIFKLLVGAQEPLTTEQLREAVSVEAGQTTWSPQRQIGNIQAVLKFCGSLVMVDEEDDTVRFIHHSARSFCLNSPRNAAQWTFTEKDANISMAETLVTYLSYNIFDTRLSRNVVPKINANEMPLKVALSTIRKHQAGKNVTSKLFKLKSQLKQDIGPTLAEAGESHQENAVKEFFLLPYAKNNWIRHTSQLETLPSLPNWHHLLDHPKFGIDGEDIDKAAKRFDHIEVHRAAFSNLSSIHRRSLFPSQMTIWALFNGHILFLKHEIIKDRGVRKIQAFVKLWFLLTRLPRRATFWLDYHLIKWLGLMFIRLGTENPAKTLFLSRLSAFDGCLVDYAWEAIRYSDIEAFTFLLNTFTVEDAQHFKDNPKLIEWAIVSGSVSMLRRLIELGLARDSHVNGRGIAQALSLDLREEVKFRLVYYLFGAGVQLSALSEDELYRAVKLCGVYVKSTDSWRIIGGPLPLQSRESIERKDTLLLRACLSGDYQVAESLLYCSANPNVSTSGRCCLDMALHSASTDRVNLTWCLLRFGAKATTAIIGRALELRHWTLALYLLSLVEPLDSSSHFFSFFTEVSPAIIESLLFQTVPKNLHTSIPQPCQLPIVQTPDWVRWQFYFTSPVLHDGQWGTIDTSEIDALTQEIHYLFTSTEVSNDLPFNDHGIRYGPILGPGINPFKIGFKSLEGCQNVCLRLTIPSSLAVIAELERRWQSESDRLAVLNTDENVFMMSHYENNFPVWDDGLDRWLLPDSFWDTPEIRQLVEQRRYLASLHFEDAYRGVQILSKCLSLFRHLPSPSTLDAFDKSFPNLYFPRRTEREIRPPNGLSTNFAYMSLRIQWLRTLGVMLDKGLLTKIIIPEELLAEMGSMIEILPGITKAHKGAKIVPKYHEIMPEVLEAAFLGLEGKPALEILIRENPGWTSQVCSWIETMDAAVFMWSMGEDAPLSFKRAFRSFSRVGVPWRVIKMLDRSLNLARGKVPELE